MEIWKVRGGGSDEKRLRGIERKKKYERWKKGGERQTESP